jgi:hypothetical protein
LASRIVADIPSDTKPFEISFIVRTLIGTAIARLQYFEINIDRKHYAEDDKTVRIHRKRRYFPGQTDTVAENNAG